MAFDHVDIRVADLAASARFYDTVFAVLGRERTHAGDDWAEWDVWGVIPESAEQPAASGLHVAFWAESAAMVDAFWQAGVDAGFASDGEPGPRPQYRDDYYGAFLLDPDGNSAEAVHHGIPRESGQVDHLWIGVSDLAAARAFYETIAPYAGLHVGREGDDRVQFRSERDSFMLVADGRPSTRNVHIAFEAPDRATIDAFHAAGVAAGYADNGAPGLRPIYGPGYYGAFVLDPEGHNVELVIHETP